MKDVRVLEIAQWTFAPAAGGILADWGADVIKIEHPVRGDAQRGLLNIFGLELSPDRHTVMEHSNRGKRSVGLDISTEGGIEVAYELAKTADVFLTNYLPSQRQKLKVDLEHIRAVNPRIIYARGTAYGDKGPERDIGGFDSAAFWARSGIGHTLSPADLDSMLSQIIPAFGDSIGAMNIAGGIAAALFHRAQTGEALELDVSLLSTAWWAAGSGVDLFMETGQVLRNPMPASGGAINPFAGNYKTSDGGVIHLCTLTPGPHIRDIFNHLGLPEAADDPRFSNAATLMQNARAASDLIAAAFEKRPFGYWRQHLKTMTGQWAPFQSLLDLASDEQALANDMLFEVEAIDGGPPMRLVRGPVQFNHEPVKTTRAPQPSEHTEIVLMELGMDWNDIEKLRAARAIF